MKSCITFPWNATNLAALHDAFVNDKPTSILGQEFILSRVAKVFGGTESNSYIEIEVVPLGY